MNLPRPCLVFLLAALAQVAAAGPVYDGTVVPANVALRWESQAPTGEFATYSRPCASEDGSKVFAFATVSDYLGEIVALDAFTGKTLWRHEVRAASSLLPQASPLFHNGYVYWAGSNAASQAFVYKLNAATGAANAAAGGWTTQLPAVNGVSTHQIAAASPVLAPGRVLLSTYGGEAPAATCHFALNDDDGSLAWANNDGGSGSGSMAYDTTRGLAYQTVFTGGTHVLRAYDAQNGSTAWTAPWTFRNPPSQRAITFKNDKILCQDALYEGNGALYAANAANFGALAWQATMSGSGSSQPLADASGNVYVCSGNSAKGVTAAFNSSGARLWQVATAGGPYADASWGDGHLFVGVANTNQLLLLRSGNGATVNTLTGGGPAGFGERTFLTVAAGTLRAYSICSDFATTVASYTPGTGVTNDYISGKPFTDSSSALGRPTVDTTGDSYVIAVDTQVPVVPVMAPCRSFELVTVGGGGDIVLKFDHKVKNDPDNAFGQDLIVFGNAFWILANGNKWNNGDPNASSIGRGTLNDEPGLVSVSQDGSTWYTYSAGPYADAFAPTLGRVYAPDAPYNPGDGNWDWNLWWGKATDATLPLNPALSSADFAYKTVAQTAQLYGESAGGGSFDLDASSLDWIQYVKISYDKDAAPDVDAVADARVIADITPPAAPTNLSLTAKNTTVTLSWTPPADTDFGGVVVVRGSSAYSGDAPSAGVGYFPGLDATLGNGQVVYNGSASSYRDQNLAANSSYHYAVFAYDQSLNYHATPATGSATTGAAPTRISPNDLNADGKSDLTQISTKLGFVYNSLMSGVTTSAQDFMAKASAPGWSPVGVADFNADGKADIALRQNSTGAVNLYLMNGAASYLQGSVRAAGAPAWTVNAVADFNGDGRADFAYYNTSTGEASIDFMSAFSVLSSFSPYTAAGWPIVAAGDFNGDGHPDLLARNSVNGALRVYLLNGASLIGAGLLYENAADWQLSTVGDFDGDGTDDLLLYDASTASLFVALLNGATVKSGDFVFTNSTGWEPTGTSDFNGDGKCDILAANPKDGCFYAYLMDGAAPSVQGFLLYGVPGWKAAAVGDYDGDGKSDLCLQDSASGTVYVLLMNGLTIKAQGFPCRGAQGWSVF